MASYLHITTYLDEDGDIIASLLDGVELDPANPRTIAVDAEHLLDDSIRSRIKATCLGQVMVSDEIGKKAYDRLYRVVENLRLAHRELGLPVPTKLISVWPSH